MNKPLSQNEMMAYIAKLQAELAAAKAKSQRKLSVKISEKGCVSLYGMGRFPVSLYASQWQRVFTEGRPLVEALIDENPDLLEDSRDESESANG